MEQLFADFQLHLEALLIATVAVAGGAVTLMSDKVRAKLEKVVQRIKGGGR